jgi:5-formaminoimidazole-4-carboxamide-1-beta-D-ribofuranosyl 5'-monophosphate synthetase
MMETTKERGFLVARDTEEIAEKSPGILLPKETE